MKKADLLNDLVSKQWVHHLVSTPILLEEKPDGSKWYNQNIMEVHGASATFRNIPFYVYEEGTEDEEAFYKDALKQTLSSDADDFKTAVAIDIMTNHPEFKGFSPRHLNSQTGQGLLKTLEDDGTGKVNTFAYLINRDSQGNITYSKIDLSSDIIAGLSEV